MLPNKKTKLNIFVLLTTVAVSILVMGSDIVKAKIIYVDTNALGANNGTSWENAFNHLQNAISSASFGSEIWVAEGVYKPDEDTAHPNGSGSRYKTFTLKNGVTIYGGFPPGGGEWHERDPNDPNNETILSGDLLGNDWPDFVNNGENSYHVVTGSGTNATAVLDGFTITGGNANGSYPNDRGGGMFNEGGRPTVNNCTFSWNSGLWGGGGMYNDENSNSILTNCIFKSNSADIAGGGMLNENSSPTLTNCTFSCNSAGWSGGGMFNGSSSPKLTNCTFINNSAEAGGAGMCNDGNSSSILTNCIFRSNSAEEGGGMCNEESSPIVTNCTFSNNSVEWCGGGMFSFKGSSPTLTNCTFNDNSAGSSGAGMYNEGESSPMVTNCTFSNNSAEFSYGGGMDNYDNSNPTVTNCTFSGNSAGYVGGGMSNEDSSSSPKIINCILWGNTAPHWPQIYNDGTSSATVSYSDVQGGWPGIGNINTDPMFMNAGNDDLRLLPDSPCIDAGNNTAVPLGIIIDLEGNPRFVDQPEVLDTGNGTAPIVDMGAFEANYLETQMKFTPQSLNPGSKGNWIKAHLVLPEGFYVEDVDANMPAIIPFLGIESEYMNIFINEDGLVEIEAAFSRSDFYGAVISDEPIEVIVMGQLTTGQKFYGTDAIRITNNFIKYLAVFSSYWLQTDCEKFEWCDGTDLNQDSVVNFIDFALFDGCCVVSE